MEELRCKGTPAQIARRVLAVLAADPDLLWLVGVKDFYPHNKLENLSFWGRQTPDIPDGQDEIKVGIMRGKWPHLGVITAERLPDRVLVTATNRWHHTEVDNAHNIRRSLGEDFVELASIWERVKAELIRLGLVIEAEPAQVKRDEDAPKIGAPRLAELDDAQATAKKNKFREYLRLILRPRDPQKKDVAAGQVGLARTTLDRYRRTWPEIEAEVKQELGAHKVRKA